MGDHGASGFEILEHTADVGVRAWSATLEETFRQSTLGLLDIVGVWQPGEGMREAIAVEGRDLGALLVDWLGEVLYLQDVRDVVITEVHTARVAGGRAHGWVELAERPSTIEGTAVKAITYHQLQVEQVADRWVATVYLDI